MSEWRVIEGDCRDVLATLTDGSVQCAITSPPYFGLRSYLADDDPAKAREIGTERTPEEYVAHLVEAFRHVRRALRKDGILWLVIGDSYAGSGKGGGGSFAVERQGYAETIRGKRMARGSGRWGGGDIPVCGLARKQLIGIPWRVAFALQDDGWWLRSDCIWHKPNAMPESARDRPTMSHEHIFLLSKSVRYHYDAPAIAEPAVTGYNGNTFTSGKTAAPHANVGRGPRNDGETRNKRDVWTVPTAGFADAHFAVYPPDLIIPCVLAGTSERGCCPDCGAPWRRVTEANNPSRGANTGADMTGGAAKTANPQTSNGLHRNGGGVYSSAAFIGWESSCACGRADTVPCVVLDPFCGAGTTGLVATRHDRNFIGIELNSEYAAMARKRIAGDAPLLQGVESPLPVSLSPAAPGPDAEREERAR